MGRVSLGKALTSDAEDDGAPGPAGSAWVGALRLRSWAGPAVWVLGVVAAFGCFLRLSRTRAVNSDGAGQALQGWDMLHGNVLLRGWTLSDVSFYTTELPQYMLVELAHGLNGDVVHIATAMSYTLMVVGAALLDAAHRRSRALGRDRDISDVRPASASVGPLRRPLASGSTRRGTAREHAGAMRLTGSF